MAGSNIQSTITVDIAAGAKLTGDAKTEFDALNKQLIATGTTAKQQEAIFLRMAEILQQDKDAMTGVTAASSQMAAGLTSVASAASLANNSTGELRAGLSSVNNSVAGNGGLLSNLSRQRIAFTDVGRLITGQGFSLRTLSSNFGLLGPQVVIAAAALGYLGEELLKYIRTGTDAAKAQKAFNDVIKDAAKPASEAIASVMKMQQTFKLAEDGVITKTQAVEQYNKTIGLTTGQVKNLREAEQALQANKDAFIQMTLQKAIAQVAAEKAAQAQVDVLVMQNKEQAQLADAAAYITETQEDTLDHWLKITKEGIDRDIKVKQDQADQFVKIFSNSSKEVEDIAKKFHFNPLGDNLKDLNKAKEELLRYQEGLKEFEKQIRQINLSPQTDLHKTLDELQDHYQKVVDLAVKAKVPYTKATEDMENERLRIIRDHGKLVLGELFSQGQDELGVKKVSEAEFDKFTEQTLAKRLAGQKSEFDKEKQMIQTSVNDQLAVLRLDNDKSQLERTKDNAQRLKIILSGYQQELQAARKNQQDTAEIENKITANTQEQALAQIAIKKAKFEMDVQLTNDTADLLQSLSNLAGQQTQAGKDLAIATATIKALATVANIIEGFTRTTPVIGYALGVVQAGIALANLTENIKKIESVNVPGQSSNSSGIGNLSTSAGSYSAPNVPQAVQTTTLSPQNVNQFTQSNTGNQPNNVRAYVVERDVTDAQNNVNNYRSNSTLGGRRH